MPTALQQATVVTHLGNHTLVSNHPIVIIFEVPTQQGANDIIVGTLQLNLVSGFTEFHPPCATWFTYTTTGVVSPRV